MPSSSPSPVRRRRQRQLSRRGFAGAVAGLAAAGTAAVALAGASTAQAAGGYTQSDLTASVSGTSVTASATITAAGASTTGDSYGICTLDADGTRVDFPRDSGTVSTDGTTATGTATFAAGTYTYFACLDDSAGGFWRAAPGQSQTFTVTGVTPPVSGSGDKVLLMVEENHTLDQVRSGMPYLTSMMDRYGYSTGHQGLTHPSLPNYLAIAFGSTFSLSADGPPSVYGQDATSLFGATIAAGGTAHVYADDATTNCQAVDGPYYAVRHTGWPYALGERALCQANDTPAGSTSSGSLRTAIDGGDLPNVGWFIPSIRHDAHAPSTLTDADDYLQSWLPVIMAGDDYRAGRLSIVITFDEGTTGSNNIPLVVINPSLSHDVVTAYSDQYGLSRWLTRVGGASPLRSAAKATDAGSLFGL